MSLQSFEGYSTAQIVKKLNIDVKHVTFRQLTKLWDCTDTYLKKCMGEGMPHKGEGVKSIFDLDTCQRWHRGEEV
jgi:hypothetical protein